jgi:hypothetical protein
MIDSTNEPKELPRFKSPPYPFISLPKAIERTRGLFEMARSHPVGLPVLAEAWGYSVSSSGAVQTAAALIQFGLLSTDGSGKSRKFQLTLSGQRLAQDADPASEKRQNLLRAAALAPKIHSELWEKFGNPNGISDKILREYLVLDRADQGLAPFSDAASSDLIAQYRETIHYAGIPEDATEVNDVETLPNKVEKGPVEKTPGGATNLLSKSLHLDERLLQEGMLSKSTTYRITVNGPVGPKEIDRLIAKLQLDRDILEGDE